MAVHHDRAFDAARRLRRDLTYSEASLWKLLRGKKLEGLRFRRQVPIGPYVTDFCCLSERLVVEVDGGIHRLREAEDAARDAWLASQDFKIIRFSNELVLGGPHIVLAEIMKAVGR